MIVERAKPVEKQPAPKNVIIEYERPGVCADKCVVDEGVIRADPRTYNSYQSCGREEVRVVDRITDLPVANGRALTQMQLYHPSAQQRPATPAPAQSYPRPATAKINASGSNVVAKGPVSYAAGPWNTTYRSSYKGAGFDSLYRS